MFKAKIKMELLTKLRLFIMVIVINRLIIGNSSPFYIIKGKMSSFMQLVNANGKIKYLTHV